MSELKPCPFCGAELKHYTDEYTNSYGKRVKEDYYMHDVTASVNYCLAEEICVGNNEKDIAAWNSRADNWISVEERLPENNTEVLISIDYGNGKQSVLMGYMRSQDVSWRGVVGQKLIGVTHWQPLPQLPKGVKFTVDDIIAVKGAEKE